MTEEKRTTREEQLKKTLMSLFKKGAIKFKDIPPRFRDEITEELIGRHPNKRFDELPIINKRFI